MSTLYEERIDNIKDIEFDLIVIGSGNGACGFLSECLKYTKTSQPDIQILVLEQGHNFFYTSDVTHQNGWSKTYSSGRIFKLHNTITPSPARKPIISGRAVTMGGGGSINYTMIHESSKWLADNVGHDVKYWDDTKEELNAKFNRPDPFKIETPFAKFIRERSALKFGPNLTPYAQPSPDHLTKNIPNLQEDVKQIYIFPTQFNSFGQRTNSGVSLVDWDKVHLRCNRKVTELIMDDGSSEAGSCCTGVQVKNTTTNKTEVYKVKHKTGRVVLACGSQSPRLLMRAASSLKITKENNNAMIGKRVNDHICMPLGIYVVSNKEKANVGPTDNYQSIFGTLVINPTSDESSGIDNNSSNMPVVVNLDFFTGDVERLLYLASSLYLCYLPFNGFKRIMGRNPFIFTVLSNAIRVLLRALIFIFGIIQGILNVITFKPWGTRNFVITTSLIKFSCVREGQYDKNRRDDQITLNFFEDENDFIVAEKAIKENLDFLQSMGSKPPLLLRLIFRFITKIPYEPYQVKRYVKHFSERTLLSEQHLAGGCVFGDVIDKGLGGNGNGNGNGDPTQTGKVFGSKNIYVADLSAVPLPRVSTQMTAYLIGHHVGKQLYGTPPSSMKKK